MSAEIYETDSFALDVDIIRRPEGVPLNLDEITLEGYAESGDGTILVGDCTIQRSEFGLARIYFPPGSFKEGFYTIQMRAENAIETQTVLRDYPLNVLRSFGD